MSVQSECTYIRLYHLLLQMVKLNDPTADKAKSILGQWHKGRDYSSQMVGVEVQPMTPVTTSAPTSAIHLFPGVSTQHSSSANSKSSMPPHRQHRVSNPRGFPSDGRGDSKNEPTNVPSSRPSSKPRSSQLDSSGGGSSNSRSGSQANNRHRPSHHGNSGASSSRSTESRHRSHSHTSHSRPSHKPAPSSHVTSSPAAAKLPPKELFGTDKDKNKHKNRGTSLQPLKIPAEAPVPAMVSILVIAWSLNSLMNSFSYVNIQTLLYLKKLNHGGIG